ncbi:MAG: hydrogenase maturation nickel metallochaperone HypA [Clostridiales Family XIII bacterium]|jgi:hydrogenase nickel incorporation protein HypA/HybF|nr:hydrogenase maturation nickel metallochaperone HypA [Clostridiales Family XIII bacterium]
MHELAIMEDVLRISADAARADGAGRVVRITIRAGALSGVIPKWANIFFKMISAGTIAEGAELLFETAPAFVSCRSCGREGEIPAGPPVFKCVHCGSGDVVLRSGREFSVERVEVEG